MGRGRSKGWGFHPCLAYFCLSHSCPAPHDEKKFLTLSPPLGALRSLTPARKTLLLVNNNDKRKC